MKPRTLALVLAAALVGAGALGPAVRAQDARQPPEDRSVHRRYDLGSLAGPRLPAFPPPNEVRLHPLGWRSASAEEVEVPPEEVLPTSGQVIELLRSAIPEPKDAPFDIEAEGDALHVTAPAATQKELEQAFEALRRTLATPYEIEVRSVSLPDGPAGDALVEELSRADALPADAVARLLSADRDGGARGTVLSAYESRWTAFEQVRARSVVSDFDVEVAQASSIADPLPREVEDGLRAAVRAARTPTGGALVSVSAAAGDLVEPVRRVDFRTTDLGTAEMPEFRGAFVSTAAALWPGETAAIVLASPVSERASVRRVLLVRLVSAPPAPQLARLDVHGVGALTVQPLRPFLFVPLPPYSVDFALDVASPKREAVAQARERLRRDVIATAGAARFERQSTVLAEARDWPGGAFVVQGDAETREAVRAAVVTIERQRVRAARVTLRLEVRGAAGAPAQLVGVTSFPALVGHGAALAAYASVPYVADFDVEIAEKARIADPVIATAVGGTVLNLTLADGPGGALRADLTLFVAGVGPPEPAVGGAAEVGVIERVPERRSQVAQSVLVAAGRASEIELGPSPWGPGRLVAVLRATRSAK